MSLDQIPHCLCGMMLYYLNIMLYASSDSYVFLEAERLLYEVNRPNASLFSVLGRPIMNEVVQSFVHYFLGHILAIVMILESETLHTASTSMHAGSDTSSIPTPVSRSIFGAVIFLVRTAGLRVFFKGVKAAIIYRLSILLLTLIIEKIERFILGPRSFVPVVARLLANVLLSDLHLTWTQATISIPSSSSLSATSLATRSPSSTLRILALPSLFFATVQLLLDSLPRLFMRFSTTCFPEYLRTADPWQPVLASNLLVNFCRLALYYPALTALTLTELRLLPEGDSTIIPSIRGRGSRIGELGLLGIPSSISGSGADNGPGLGTRLGWDLVRWPTVLWLWELYAKNCVVHFTVKFLLEGSRFI